MNQLSRTTPATADVLRTLLAQTDEAGIWGLRVVQLTGRPAGSVYPILERLETAGWVTSVWQASTERRGPRRRLYGFTPDGRAAAFAVLDGRAAQAPGRRRVPLTSGTAGAGAA